jgi:SprT protein
LDNNYLASYIPESSNEIVDGWIRTYPVQIRISRDRITKSGDYRPPYGATTYHRISINHNLNKFSFLITLTHEFAHLLTWNFYKRRAQPHGDEWRQNYRTLLFSLIEINVFPKEIEHALIQTLVRNSQPIHTSEYNLSVILSKYDSGSVKQFLDDLVSDSIFSIPNGNVFRKGDKIRTRYKCYCLNNKKWYLISPAMHVKPICNALDFP